MVFYNIATILYMDRNLQSNDSVVLATIRNAAKELLASALAQFRTFASIARLWCHLQF